MDAIRSLMGIALEQARAALATGDVPIGAVVAAPDGRILAVGRNEREATGDPTAHAEVVAIRAAAAALGTWRLDGCTLAVTLEPCPMCAGAMVLARLRRLVFGCADPRAGACGTLFDIVRDARLNHRCLVRSGVLGEECARLLTGYFQRRRRA